MINAEKIYYHGNSDECNYFKDFKVINILNLASNQYELLYIDRDLFNNKLNEIRLETYQFIHPKTKFEYDKSWSNTDFRSAIDFFYQSHTGITACNVNEYFLSGKKFGSKKGNNSFFNIKVNIQIIERPYFFKRISINEAIKIFLNSKCPSIAKNILDSVFIWSLNLPYKKEQLIHDEMRKIFSFNKKMTQYHFSCIDIERLSEFYINLINRL